MEEMEAYTGFAEVYDTFMDDTPYEEWADFLAGLIGKYGISRPVQSAGEAGCAAGTAESTGTEQGSGADPSLREALEEEKNLVLDLGCGTGTLTELLSQKGFDMIGVDSSEEMLQLAMDKKEKTGSRILYLCQDMRDLDLYSTVGTVVSVCDSINYLLEDEDVADTFSLVENYLYPGGIFIFDFNTLYKYETVIGDTTIAENRDDCSFIWENYYHEEEHINEYDLTIFAREKKNRESFHRFQETHYQRGYTLEEMKSFVENSGLSLILVMDAETHREPTEDSERIYVVAGKGRKAAEECNTGENR